MSATPTTLAPTNKVPYTTNASLDELATFLRSKRRIAVITHVKPDGDAVGSSMGLVRALNLPEAASSPWVKPAETGTPRAEAWYFGPLPPWLKDMVGETPYRVLEHGGAGGGVPDAETLKLFDAFVIVDTGSWVQIEAAKFALEGQSEKTVIVDHHVQGDAEIGGKRHIDTGAAAVCQIVAELATKVLGKQSMSELPAAVAEPLYLGCATDTGWFRHSNVGKRVMSAAGELLEAGADHVRLYQMSEQRETPARLKLISRALASVEFFHEGRTAVMRVTKKDLLETGAGPGDSGGFTDFTQSIPEVRVSVVLSEASASDFGGKDLHEGSASGGPVTKISMRSKPRTSPREAEVDVNAVAKVIGGGGHVRAAGARTTLNLEQTKQEVLRLIAQQIDS